MLRPTLPPIRYQPSHAAFRADVVKRLPPPGRFTGHKAWLLPALIAAVYALLLGGACTVLLEALVVVLCLLAALGLAHDASHGALSRLNRLGAFVFDLVGVNGYVWHFDHVVAHHTTPNVSRYDANLYGWGPIRLDPHSPHRPWHRFQHLYAPLIYATASLYKVYLGDFLAIGRTRADAYLPPQHSAATLARMVLFKAWSILFTLVIPLAVTGKVAPVVAGYLLGHVCNGLLMGAIFQPTHTNELVAWPRPDPAGQMATSFDAHVLATAADFAVTSRWVTWLAGGLNIHAVHHLFPGVPHLQLPAAAAVVADAAAAHGLRYLTFPTWSAALASHFRALKRLGEGAASEAPLTAALAAADSAR